MDELKDKYEGLLSEVRQREEKVNQESGRWEAEKLKLELIEK